MLDFFKKDKFTYTPQDDFFTFNDEKIDFEDINAIYSRDIEHSLNSVYEKRELVVTLQLQNVQELQLQADTNELEQYKILSELQEAVIAYRYKKLHLKYLQEGKLLFLTKQDEYSLLFEDKKLFVKYNKAKRVNSVDFEVKSIKQEGFMLKLKGEGEEEITNSWFISDFDLFSKLATESVEFITPFEFMIKRRLFEAKFYRYFMLIFIPFGLNGIGELFFKTSLFCHTQPIATLSLIAGMLLAIGLLTMPMYIVVDKLNARKKELQGAALAGRKANVKEFDLSNLLIVVLVVGLGILLWEKI
jgi:hypothetical protein